MNSNLYRLSTVCVCFLSLNAHALETDYSLSYAAAYSDNIRQAPDNEESELIHTLGAGLNLSETNRRINSVLRLNLLYNIYSDDTFENDVVGTVDTNNTFYLIPGTLRWVLDDSLGYVIIDNTGNNTPQNYQQVNYFSTGPIFTAGITSVDDIELESRYENYYEEVTNGDSERILYGLRWIHRFSPTSRLSTNYQFVESRFDDNVNNIDFDRHDAFMRYESGGRASQYFVELGRTRVERVNQVETEGGRGSVGYTKQVTRSTTLSLTYRNELSDAADELSVLQQTAPGTGVGVQVGSSTDLVRIQRGEIQYRIRGSLSEIGLRYFKEDLDFQETAADEIVQGVGLDFAYRFSDRSNMRVNLYFEEEDFLDINRLDKTTSALAAYNFIIRRNITLSVNAAHFERDSTDSTSSYTENIVGLQVQYTSGAERRPRR